MPNVYAVHATQDDLSAARRWGDIKFINHRYINGDEINHDGQMPLEFELNLRAAADDFTPDDYLLIVGDHLQFIAFSAMLADKYGSFKVLRYDRREGAYFPVRIVA